MKVNNAGEWTMRGRALERDRYRMGGTIQNGEGKEEREKRSWSKTAHIVVLDFLSAEWVREEEGWRGKGKGSIYRRGSISLMILCERMRRNYGFMDFTPSTSSSNSTPPTASAPTTTPSPPPSPPAPCHRRLPAPCAHSLKTGLQSYPHVANTLLSLYAKSKDLTLVKRVFDNIENPDVYSWTTLLSAGTKLGQVGYACEVFEKMPHRSVAVWNAIVTGCAENGYSDVALDMFRRMHLLGVRHDNYTFASVLSLCSLELVDFGRQVHSMVIKTGFLGRASVINAQLTMYFGCGNVNDAYEVFEEVEGLRDEITYNAMIVVHVQELAAVTMYSSCGDLNAARMVFERLEGKDIVSWNAMITSYAQGNLGGAATLAYVKMQREGTQPDEFTIGSLLASSKSIEIVEMIQSLVIRNGLIFKIEVSNAFISTFSKHGYMKQAYEDPIRHGKSRMQKVELDTLMRQKELLNGKHIELDFYTWWTLFSSCAAHGNMRLGRTIAGFLLQKEQNNPAVYVQLSNIYANAGQWEEAANLREMMKSHGVIKQPGYSWVTS
ncbi:hypothetical protein RHGRI_009171 [Rhododendron griersonianum]|uniref:Pentatricopeptide repeat-containing protein n=1 Tax=Rhododendron griersonianum TaxID=479676 RepID=A0AAV6L4D3_9ERIC|nr:hypothetical protein RHGRI_009171 [Rhododendron griersonianum]